MDTIGKHRSITFVNDIVVRNESGSAVVYAAVQNNSAALNGLFRSANGGTTFTQVLPTPGINSESVSDIEIGQDNKLYVGARSKTGGDASVYLSTDDTGTTWSRQQYDYDGRVEIACSPSNALVAYAVFVDDNKVGDIAKSNDGGATWFILNKPEDADLGIPADDFSRTQAWYDIILAVHPTDPNTVIVGGVDLFSTSNGGSTWSQISKWSNNPSMNTLDCSLVHADQHNIVFRPGFDNELIVGNDGGVYYCTNLALAATTNVFSARNLNYNVTQFYTGAIHPTQTDFMLGGTQDNGTEKFTLTGFDNTISAIGGDGGMCFIDQVNPQFQIGSTVYNDIRLSTDGGNTFSTTLIDDATGNFINQGDYDSNLKILYTAKSSTEIYRVGNVTTTPNLTSIPVSLGSMATAFRVSPYTTAASNLFVGTLAGKLFRITNAQGTPTPVEITGPAFPNGAISSIAFGADENQILVTFSNYGVISVWETRDGGITWINREGNLPNMPVRWAEYHPQNFDQVYLATELGIWTTDNIINIPSPVWNSTNGGLANVRTDMLRVRKNDGMIMAATHGRGVFTAIIPSNLDQTITFTTIQGTKTFGDGTFKLSAKSTSGLPITFLSSNPSVVTITDSTVTIVGAGSVDISATQTGNTYYAAATPEVQTLVVNKAAQTITFGALPEKDVDDPDFTISATATSGLLVSFASNNTPVATVVGDLVVINGAGTAVITASQAGNSNFLAAPNIPQNFTVVTRIINIPATLDFEEVFIGEKPVKTFKITNTGTGSLQVTSITYPTAYTGVTNPVSDGLEVTVTFTPTSVADFNGNIVIVSNSTSGNNILPVTGSGILITSPERDLDLEVEVYPNPVGNVLRIKADLFTPETVFIIDMSGRELQFNRTALREKVAEFDLSRLSKGSYVLKVPKKDGYFTKQINKQ